MDVSEQVRNKRLQEINEYKDLLLSTVSHDMKTPLNCMIQIIENNENETEVSHLRQNNTVFLENCQILLNKIHDIIDYSAMMNAEFELHPRSCNLNDSIKLIQQQFRFQAESKQIRLYTSSLLQDTVIENDEQRIRQVLFNLVGNSLKFTEKGGYIQILLLQPENKDYIQLQVQDTGTGIPLALQGNLFELFGTIKQNKGGNRVNI